VLLCDCYTVARIWTFILALPGGVSSVLDKYFGITDHWSNSIKFRVDCVVKILVKRDKKWGTVELF